MTMLVRPTTKLYVCITDDGRAIPDTVLTDAEFNDPVHRHAAEGLALSGGDCLRIRWEDVTDAEAFWLDDDEHFVLTEKGIGYLQSASLA
jgi:hypothetical protein